MGLLSKLFHSKSSAGGSPSTQEVSVHFAYGSTNFQILYALQDQLESALLESKLGEFDGHDLATDGSDGTLFFSGPDAETIFATLRPILETAQFMRGATVTLRLGPKGFGTAKRVIELP